MEYADAVTQAKSGSPLSLTKTGGRTRWLDFTEPTRQDGAVTVRLMGTVIARLTPEGAEGIVPEQWNSMTTRDAVSALLPGTGKLTVRKGQLLYIDGEHPDGVPLPFSKGNARLAVSYEGQLIRPKPRGAKAKAASGATENVKAAPPHPQEPAQERFFVLRNTEGSKWASVSGPWDSRSDAEKDAEDLREKYGKPALVLPHAGDGKPSPAEIRAVVKEATATAG